MARKELTTMQRIVTYEMVQKVKEMRELKKDWSEIASEFGISNRRARTLVQEYEDRDRSFRTNRQIEKINSIKYPGLRNIVMCSGLTYRGWIESFGFSRNDWERYNRMFCEDVGINIYMLKRFLAVTGLTFNEIFGKDD